MRLSLLINITSRILFKARAIKPHGHKEQKATGPKRQQSQASPLRIPTRMSAEPPMVTMTRAGKGKHKHTSRAATANSVPGTVALLLALGPNCAVSRHHHHLREADTSQEAEMLLSTKAKAGGQAFF